MAETRPKRDRKSVEHFSPGGGPKEPAKVVVPEGKGTKLGEIPNVNFKLDKVKAGDELLEDLHMLLYKSKGKAQTRKKEIKSFSGFVFAEENKEGERNKVEARLSKWTLNHLNSLMDVLDVPRGSGEEGTKEKKVERLLHFLEEPQALSDKDLASQAAKKKAAKTKGKTAAKTDKVTKKAEEAPKATSKGKKTAASQKEAPAGNKRKAPAKEEKPAKKAKKDTKAKAAEESEEEAAEEAAAPAENAAPAWPASKQVKADVEAILQAALDKGKEITLGAVYAQLGEKYGMSVDEIKKKKASIKNTVTKLQEKQAGIEQEEQEVPAEPAAAAEGAEPAGEEQPGQTGAEEMQPMETEEVVPEESAAEPASEEPLITEPATNEGDEQQPEQPMEAEAAAEPEAHPAPEVAAIPEANGAEPAVEQAPTAEVQPATEAAVPSVQEPAAASEAPKASMPSSEDAIFPESTFGDISNLNF